MTAILPLFSWQPAARKSDPETSHKAAGEHLELRAKDRETVLAVHRAHPAGITDFELADIMGRSQTSVGKRRGELRDMGLIVATDERRAAPSGSSATVWRIRKP